MIQKRKVGGMNIGSASLVMVFSVLCLTIFAVLSVVTARNEWRLAEKSAQAVTDYYTADSLAAEILDEISRDENGQLSLPSSREGTLESVNGTDYLNYFVSIDEYQWLWVQVYDDQGVIKIARWEVEEQGLWNADQSINVWGG